METIGIIFKCRGCGERMVGRLKRSPDETPDDVIKRCMNSDQMWIKYDVHICRADRHCVADFTGVTNEI